MGNNGFLNISEDYLEELIGLQASKLAGKSMKRFELFTDTKTNSVSNSELLKRELKELVYETFRDFRDMLIAHNYGLGVTILKFKTKEKDKENIS
jgi:hypothetical protein